MIRFGRFTETPLANETMLALKQLSRFRNSLVHNVSDLKRKAIVVFSDIFGKTSTEVLMECTTPSDFEHVSVDQLTEMMEKASRKKVGRNVLNKLHLTGVTKLNHQKHLV